MNAAVEKWTHVGLIIFLLTFNADNLFAQTQVRHHSPTFIERGKTELLEFELQQTGDTRVAEARLFVRTSDQSSYRQREGRFENNRARFSIQIDDPVVNSVEYYVSLRMTDGQELIYPNVTSGDAPVRVDVVEPKKDSLPPADFIDFTILSPKPGRVLNKDDILVAIVFFYDEEDLEEGTFHLNFNGSDVTQEANISPFMINYRPDSPREGLQRVQVTFRQGEREYEVAGWNFQIIDGQKTDIGREFGTVRNRPVSGDIELGARNQQISGMNYDALNGRVRISGSEGKLAWSARSYVTSQESSRMQPHNRFYLGLSYGESLQVQAGDVYPYFNNLAIAGRRVRGLSTTMDLVNDRLELQLLYGQMNRRIPTLYHQIEYEDDLVNGEVVDTLYTLQFSEQGRGMFTQKVSGGRLAIGDRDRFQLAFHAIKMEDDSTSLNLIYDYNDILAYEKDLNGDLRDSDIQNLEQNPGKLQVSGGNPKPRGNFVAGADLTLSMDNDRIRFYSEGGFSFFNNDISGGTLNRQRAEELGIVMSPGTESLISRLSGLIIINEKMDSPPFRYIENERGDLELETLFPASILAGDSRVNLNYFGHQLQVRYRWIGPDYHSMANSTVRRDVAGFNISDRFRLLDNRLYLTFGYEHLRNNLMDQLDVTLRTNTYRSSISWYPVNPVLPRLNISASWATWKNRIRRFNPFVAQIDSGLEYAAVRNFQEVEGNILPAPSPRLHKTLLLSFSAMKSLELFGENHELNLNFGLMKTEDDYFSYGDYANQNLSVRFTSRIDRLWAPLQTELGYSYTHSESTGGLSDNSISGIDLRTRVFLIDGKLNVNLDLAFTGNRFSTLPLVINNGGDPVSQDNNYYEPAATENRTVRRTNAWIVRGGTEYEFNRRHTLQGRMNFTNVYAPFERRGLPNDHILQIRYIYRL